jgi:hypothetical protein
MTRLLARAVVAAAVAAAALTQLHDTQRLLAWELILLGVVVYQMRVLPSAKLIDDPPLLDLSPAERSRLPRPVSTAELTVLDAVTGHLAPDRRLQPILVRIATHRLRKRGLELESQAARDAMGEETWSWLASPTTVAPEPAKLEVVVASLEEL